MMTKPAIGYEDEKQSDQDFMASMVKQKINDTPYATVIMTNTPDVLTL